MLYMVTFTIHIPQMLAYIPYMNPMGIEISKYIWRNDSVSSPVFFMGIATRPMAPGSPWCLWPALEWQ